MDYTRKELLSVPKRHWSESIIAKCAYIIPSGRKHDSGYSCIDLVAMKEDGTLVRCGGGCDDISFRGNGFRMDCIYPSRIIRIWNNKHFVITPDVSSIDFEEIDHERLQIERD